MSIHYTYGIHAVTKAIEQGNARSIFLLRDKKNKAVSKVLKLAETHGLSVELCDDRALLSRVGDVNHQGVVASIKSLESFSEADIPELFERQTRNIILVLDGVTDPHNAGACLRTADAFGVSMVIVPKNNSAPLNATVRKVACGGAETVPYIQVTNLARTLTLLKELGAWAYGADMDGQDALKEVDFSGHVLLVMGSEGQGLRRLTREHLDKVFHIPMQGQVESLNVSVATAISLYEITR